MGGDGVEEVVGRGGAGRGRDGCGVVARRRARARAAASAAATGGGGRVVVAVTRHPRPMRRGSLGGPGPGSGGGSGGVGVTGSSGGKEMRFGAEAPDYCPVPPMCRPLRPVQRAKRTHVVASWRRGFRSLTGGASLRKKKCSPAACRPGHGVPTLLHASSSLKHKVLQLSVNCCRSASIRPTSSSILLSKI